MSIFSRRTLDVTTNDIKKEYRKMTDEELNKELFTRIGQTARLHSETRFDFLQLIISCPFTRKQTLMFLDKLNTSNQMIAYMYRHLVRCAYSYGVPKVIINNYMSEKEKYSLYKDGTYTMNKFKEIHKMRLRANVKTLMSATLEMIHRSKSRKAKLEKLTDKIVDKNI